jgi:hypothetical protein
MTTLLKKLTEFFTIAYRSDLEQFINNKRPTSAAEVEFWVQQYQQKTMARGL